MLEDSNQTLEKSELQMDQEVSHLDDEFTLALVEF